MTVAWLKTGEASKEMAKKDEAMAEKRKQETGKMFRFFLKKDEPNVKITFVDGDLSPEGLLLPPRYYEHHLSVNGKWGNYYVCPKETNPDSQDPCPICGGGDRPSLVGLFTVIDHRVTQGGNGKVYRDQPKLLVAKTQSLELLSKMAVKRGGLAGAKFDVYRTGDKDAGIGGMFDFIDKRPIEELKELYTIQYADQTGKMVKKCLFEPADYTQEIVYRSADELLKLGFGKPVESSGPYMGSKPTGATDYAGKL